MYPFAIHLCYEYRKGAFLVDNIVNNIVVAFVYNREIPYFVGKIKVRGIGEFHSSFPTRSVFNLSYRDQSVARGGCLLVKNMQSCLLKKGPDLSRIPKVRPGK